MQEQIYATGWHCDTNASGTDCFVSASTTAYVRPAITSLDFIFVSSIVVFLLLPIFWRVLFSPFGKGEMTL